ncbi:MAG: hypothetical protein MRY83_02075 [Flavobacteriales bacterium]|nr:hypothetical protein [Flavobacteriales bacterium]
MSKKVVFLGSKDIGMHCFRHLIEKQQEYGFAIVGSLSNNRPGLLSDNCNIKELSQAIGIPFLNSLDELNSLGKVDLLISIQYHEILKSEHISLAKKAINLHMAPLPEYRGCNQFSFAIIDESKIFGTTIHTLDVGIDSGSILFEKRWKLKEGISVKDLYLETYEHSIALFENHLKDLIQENYQERAQSSFTDRSSAFHLRSDIKHLKNISATWPKEKILKYYRATYFPPFDPPLIEVNGTKIPLTSKWIEQNL